VQTPPVRSSPAPDKLTCEAKAQIDHGKNWIRSCYLLGKLTTECQKIFDSDGNYMVPVRPGTDRIKQWTNDSTACACELPLNVARQLDESLKSDKDLCAIKLSQQ
jgi:hypothetical protein